MHTFIHTNYLFIEQLQWREGDIDKWRDGLECHTYIHTCIHTYMHTYIRT